MSEPDDARHEKTDDSGAETGDDGKNILEGGGIDTDERAGRSLGIDVESEPDDDTRQEMEEERERRLDPENRPDGAEVDNTQRTFDVDRGMFTDDEEYDEGDDAPYVDPEDPNSDASASASDNGKQDDEHDEADEDDEDDESDKGHEGHEGEDEKPTDDKEQDPS